MKQRDMERALGILCAVLCIVGLLTGCGRIQEEGPSDPAGPVEPAGPESPDRELPEPPADPQGPPAGQETLPQAPSGEAQVPALEGESPADVGWPDRKESAVTLRALVEKGGTFPELVRAFSDYFNYNGRNSELDYLPVFQTGEAIAWEPLTYYVAVMRYQEDAVKDTFTREIFDRLAERYLGDIVYEHRSSGYLSFDGETYVPTGWDTNGGQWYRLVSLTDLGDGNYRAALDGVEFSEGIWPEAGSTDPLVRAVLDWYPEAADDFDLWRTRLMELLAREDYEDIFDIHDRVTITFRFAGEGTGNAFTYLSCQRTGGERLRPEMGFPEREEWMQAVRAALPEISEIHRAGDGPEPDTAYLPPEHVWGILRSDEWQFVDQYTYEHTMCMGVSDLLCLYSGEKLVLRVMEHYGFGEQRTLLIFDETFTPGAEGAKIDGQIRILAPAECYQDLLDTLGEPVEMIEQET